MSLVLERRASKDEILELYLNDVYLGQRGSFAIHGVAEAARIFFGKDVANLTLAEAALIAGVIQSPAPRSPFANPERAVERRNVVLQAMADEDFIDAPTWPSAAIKRAAAGRGARRGQRGAVFRRLGRPAGRQDVPGVTAQAGRVDVLHDARPEPAARRAGRRARRPGERRQAARKPASAPAGRRPRWSPSIRAPARSSRWSAAARTTSRSTTAPSTARRQPGSVFKPFVYLAAFEQAAEEGRADLTPATMVLDEPATFDFDDQDWDAAELR